MMAENEITKEKFSKADSTKEYVEAEGHRGVDSGIAESCHVEEDGEHRVSATVLKGIS